MEFAVLHAASEELALDFFPVGEGDDVGELLEYGVLEAFFGPSCAKRCLRGRAPPSSRRPPWLSARWLSGASRCRHRCRRPRSSPLRARIPRRRGREVPCGFPSRRLRVF